MSAGRIILITIISGLLGVSAALIVKRLSPEQTAGMQLPGVLEEIKLHTRLPSFRFPDLDDKIRTSGEWKGKVLVLNFWATWCPPCLREIPDFMTMQEELGPRGLQFVGIAIDQKDLVQDFVGRLGVNYPILLGEDDAIHLSRELGNRFGGLPFTVVFDREGELVFAKAGELSREPLETELKPLF